MAKSKSSQNLKENLQHSLKTAGHIHSTSDIMILKRSKEKCAKKSVFKCANLVDMPLNEKLLKEQNVILQCIDSRGLYRNSCHTF